MLQSGLRHRSGPISRHRSCEPLPDFFGWYTLGGTRTRADRIPGLSCAADLLLRPECSFDTLCKLLCRAFAPVVKEHVLRLFVRHVVVDGDYVNARIP